MIECIILNKKSTRNIVLIHGLFANAGFWLPYIHHFPDHKLLLLNINYELISNLEAYTSATEHKLQSVLAGDCDALIAHSMGAVIGRSIGKVINAQYYEVCPVTISVRTDVQGFKDEIKGRTNWSQLDIERQLEEARVAVERFVDVKGCSGITYIPNNDNFFSYKPTNPFHLFSGNHFDIEEAVRSIARGIKLC